MSDRYDLHNSIFRGDFDTVRRILHEYPSLIDSRDKNGDTPLHVACLAKQIGLIGSLEAYGPDVNARGRDGRTPLHYAVQEGRTISLVVVWALLRLGADPDIPDARGLTPADWAKRQMKDERSRAEVLTQLERASRNESSGGVNNSEADGSVPP